MAVLLRSVPVKSILALVTVVSISSGMLTAAASVVVLMKPMTVESVVGYPPAKTEFGSVVVSSSGLKRRVRAPSVLMPPADQA